MLGFSEDKLIEQPAIELFQSFDWDYINRFDEFETSNQMQTSQRDVST
jgi:hypothetical protein